MKCIMDVWDRLATVGSSPTPAPDRREPRRGGGGEIATRKRTRTLQHRKEPLIWKQAQKKRRQSHDRSRRLRLVHLLGSVRAGS